jgi:hypothetical protein
MVGRIYLETKRVGGSSFKVVLLNKKEWGGI